MTFSLFLSSGSKRGLSFLGSVSVLHKGSLTSLLLDVTKTLSLLLGVTKPLSLLLGVTKPALSLFF